MPALVTLGQRPVAGEQLLEPLVRGGEDGFVGVGRPHAVAPLHLVGVRAGLARQHAGVGAQADHLVAQPAVLELVEQRLCLDDERSRIDRRLRVDGGRQLRRAVVGVDDPFDVAAELQPQPEVALRGGLGHAASLRRSSQPEPGSGKPVSSSVSRHTSKGRRVAPEAGLLSPTTGLSRPRWQPAEII